MKAKLIVNNQEIEVEISEEEYKKLQPEKKTGYERVKQGSIHYYVDFVGNVNGDYDDHDTWYNKIYDIANYYSDQTVAKNNARADKLMRQLRRFAVEHREKELNWNDGDQKKYFIYYRYAVNKVDIEINYEWRVAGLVYFDSKETAQLAIDTFHDELIWYFTEYKDSL
jgi:hypothetical protein